MDLMEAKHKEIRQRLFAIQLALEKAKKFENEEVLANLKRQHEEIKKELAQFKTEQKQRGGKVA